MRAVVLAVIPGNPGDARFYGDFARALEALGHEVIVAGHEYARSDDGLLSYAQHQAAAIVAQLRGRSPDDVDLVLVGHSVGAYLAYVIVTQRLLPVARVFALCPFLSRPSFSGRLLLKVASSSWFMTFIDRVWRALPDWVQRPLVALAGAGAHGELVRSALANGDLRAWGTMARAEAREIATRADAAYLFAEPLFADPRRFRAVLCPRDRWAPRRWPRADLAVVTDAITHAFVVDPVQCRTMARLIDEALTA